MGERRGGVPGQLEGPRQGRVDHRLRRVHRAEGRRRGPGPHLRDVMDAARPTSIEDPGHRRYRRGEGPERQQAGGEDLAVPEADRERPLAGPRHEVPRRHADRRACPEPDRLRSVRPARGGNGRSRPYLRHVLDEADQAPERGRAPRREGRGHGSGHRQGATQDLSRHQAVPGEPVARDRREVRRRDGCGGEDLPHPQVGHRRRDPGGHRRLRADVASGPSGHLEGRGALRTGRYDPAGGDRGLA